MAGQDFCIVAGDTRMSSGFSIKSRNVSKIYKLCAAAPTPRLRTPTPRPLSPRSLCVPALPRKQPAIQTLTRAGNVVLGTAGFRGDITTLQKLLRAKLTSYEHQHGTTMKAHAVGQMLGNTLYGRRFFPYYTWNVVGGLDEDGVGVVYSYDPVGNYERVRVSVTGSGESLIQPLLDNQLERQHQQLGAKPPPLCTDLPLQEAINLIKDAFYSAGERDIRTGDAVEICIITKEGIRMETYPLNID